MVLGPLFDAFAAGGERCLEVDFRGVPNATDTVSAPSAPIVGLGWSQQRRSDSRLRMLKEAAEERD